MELIIAQLVVVANSLDGPNPQHLQQELSSPSWSSREACGSTQIGFLSSMTSDERTLISNLFDRLNQAGTQRKDPEADEYIRSKVSEQPSAPYFLVQSTLVMQQALTAAQTRIGKLEKQLAETARPSQEPSGGFLSGVANLFGVGQTEPAPRPVQTPPPLPTQPASPSSYAPPSIQQPPIRGGGFLQNALSTAAGVAGGALLFQGIQNMLGHNPGPFAGLTGPAGGLIGNQPVVENTEINVFEPSDASSATDQSASQDDASSDQDATADDDSTTDSGSDDSFTSDSGGDFFGGDDSYV
jgi:uncharacterized protein